MVASGFEMISLLMVLASGGDVLDHISSDAYWKIKGVNDVSVTRMVAEIAPPAPAGDFSQWIKQLGGGTFAEREDATRKIHAMGPAAIPQLQKFVADADPEVANRVRGLIRQIEFASKGAQIRKLMAIRTLGEQRKQEALPALKPLLDSKEMFVADYARRAIARIEGKPLPARDIATPLAADVQLLPGNCAVVLQARIGNRQPLTLDKMLAMLPPGITPQDRDQMIQQATTQFIQTVDQIGNVRVDGITLAVSEDAGQDNGFVVLIARGEYDFQAVEALLAKTEQITSEASNGTKLWKPANDKDVAWFFPSNQQGILIGGPAKEKLPLKELIAAAQNGRMERGLTTNRAMSRLLTTVDPKAPVWGVFNVADAIKKTAPFFSAFDSVTLTSRQEKETLFLEMKATGSDAAKVAAAVETINKGLAEARQHAPQAAQMMPAMKPMVDLIMSIKCEAKDTSAKLTAQFEGDALGTMMPMMMLGTRAAAAPPQPVPVPEKVDPKP